MPDGRAPHPIEADSSVGKKTRSTANEIAIIGMACRFPGNVSCPESFWALLSEGRHGIVDVPPERWDSGKYHHTERNTPGKMYCSKGGFLEGIDLFDASLFGIARREAIGIDPQQRLLLEVSWEAFEDAGLAPLAQAGTNTGVYVGISTSDYLQLTIRRNEPNLIDAYSGTGNAFSVAAGRISYTFGLHGPSIAIDTACSSSLVSVHLASRALRNRECDTALAGGVNLILQPDTTLAFSRAQMLAGDGFCKTFDASADGYVRGEGCGLIVLKRLDDALRDGDRIHAVIRGSAVNQDGQSNGLTAPNGSAQEAVIREALRDSGFEATDVDYVEAHGTGTPLGDPIEIRSLAAALGQRRRSDRPLLVGSVKTNLGHLEAAAGIAGLMKAVLSLRNRYIPAHLHYSNPNQRIDWDSLPVRVASQGSHWPSYSTKAIAGVSSFGFNGTNAHILIEESPDSVNPASVVDRPIHLLTLSARTPELLAAQVARSIAHLGRRQTSDIGSIAFTANTGRSHFEERLAVVGKDSAQMSEALAAWTEGQTLPTVRSGRAQHPDGVVFLFTGQGSQHFGMGRELYESSPTFASIIDRCADCLKERSAWDLKEVLWGDDSGKLDQTEFTQPALFAVEWGLAELWKSWGIRPAAVVGHSIGEYVAAGIAGVFGLEDGLELVRRRAQLMASVPGEGTMAAVSATPQEVERLLALDQFGIAIAAINGPDETVVSGSKSGMQRFLEVLQAEKITARQLHVSHAFHSSQMDPTLAEFESAARLVGYRKPSIPWANNIDGTWQTDAPEANYWCHQLRQPVRFLDAIRAVGSEGFDVFLEIGPQPVLSALGKRCLPQKGQVWLASMRRGRSDWRQMLETVADLYVRGEEVDWNGFDRDYARKKTDFPTSVFNRQRFWLEPSTVPFKELQPAEALREHPLLGWKLQLPIAEEIWESTVGADASAYLREHSIFGRPTFPATGYLELAIAVAKERNPGSDVRITDLQILEPLLFNERGPSKIQVVVAESSFAIFQSPPEDGTTPWKALARGTFSIADGFSASTPSRDRVESETSGEELYELLGAHGLNYGPSFRGVDRVWQGEAYAVGKILPRQGISAEGYHFHPAILDACLHVLALDLNKEQKSKRTWLPVGFTSAEFGGLPVSAPIWCHAKLEQAERGSKGIRKADLHIFDEAGTVVGRILGLQLKQVPKALWNIEGEPARHDSTYVVEWREAQSERKNGIEGHWIVVAASNTSTDGVVGLLKGKGCTVEVQAFDKPDIASRMEAELNSRFEPSGIVFLSSKEAISSSADPIQLRDTHLAFCLLQSLVKANHSPKQGVWFVSDGAVSIEEGVVRHGLASTSLIGLARTVRLEHPEIRTACVDLNLDNPSELENLIGEIESNSKEDVVAFRNGGRFVQRLVPVALDLDSSKIEFQRLEVQGRGNLDHLVLKPMERRAPRSDEIEIAISATGLNFRDVLSTLGLYPGDPGPLGCECAGKVSAIGSDIQWLAVGDDVIAIAPGCFADYVTVPATSVWKIPNGLTSVGAATLPIAFLTAEFGLSHLAHIKKGDRILIHAAAGGVGIAAVQIALRAGAEVFATASPPKWEALRAIGVANVFNSRTTDYADSILQATDGQGIDIVLNSLYGEHIPKSLGLLRQKGFFLEIGKRDIWTQSQMAMSRPDVEYCVYDLAEEIRSSPGSMHEMFGSLLQKFGNGSLTELPSTTFELKDASLAFRFMAQAKHVGKVVVTPNKTRETQLRHDRTYLITGGLGALGLTVADWMAANGAGTLVLAGRSVPSGDTLDRLAALSDAASVVVAQVDVASLDDLTDLFREQLSELPPLAGIIHAAGVLEDSLFSQLDWSQFEKVLKPKVQGAWNLHRLSSDLKLDFFALFSSMTSVLGSPGQANYVAANAFLDGLASYRRGLGLPCVSINWGPWTDAGMASTLTEGRRDLLSARGIKAFDAEEGLKVFSQVLGSNRTQVMAAQMDWARFLDQMPGGEAPTLLDGLEGTAGRDAVRQERAVLRDQVTKALKSAPAKRRKALIEERLVQETRQVLGLTPSDPIGIQQGFSSLGLDSLMAVELRSRLQDAFGISLPATVALEYPNLEDLAAFVLQELKFEPSEAQISNGATARAASLQDKVAVPRDESATDDWSEDDLAKMLENRLSQLQSRRGLSE